jgi:hypothetical protein
LAGVGVSLLPVIVGGLRVPERLIALMEAGRWPNREDSLVRHEFLVPQSLLTPFRSNPSDYLHLYPPLFELAHPGGFWNEACAGSDIRLEALIAIADFGWGTDAPIILDYGRSEDQPSVRCLRYPCGLRREWVHMADSFDGFVDYFSLDTVFAGLNGKFSPNEGRCFYWHEDAIPKPIRCDKPVVERGHLHRGGGDTPPADACAFHVDLIHAW